MYEGCADCKDGYTGPREVVDWNTYDRTVVRPGDGRVDLFDIPLGKFCERLGRTKTEADTNLDSPAMVPKGFQLLIFRIDLFLDTPKLDVLRMLETMTIQIMAADKFYTPIKVHDMVTSIFEGPIHPKIESCLNGDVQRELAALTAQHRRYLMHEHLHITFSEYQHFLVRLHVPAELAEPVGVALSLGDVQKRPLA